MRGGCRRRRRRTVLDEDPLEKWSGLSRSNLAERLQERPQRRISRHFY